MGEYLFLSWKKNKCGWEDIEKTIKNLKKYNNN